MRGFLIFLAVAFPVMLASPFFWSLVRMEFGAERVQQMSVDIDEAQTVGRLHWTEGAMPFPKGTKTEPCWA